MLHELLKDKKLVLASASPRRKEIFQLVGLTPMIIPSDVHEPLDERPPYQLVREHALHKATSVAKLFDSNTIVVGADTLVWINKTILGKPRNTAQAESYLALLSGRKHTVYTGVSIIWNNRIVADYEKSVVEFRQINDRDINSYVLTGEPMDKAGAYGIQGFGCQFIKGIKGCYFNVMGFPVHLFYIMLEQLLSDNNLR
jgi:septum formation protein